MKVFEAPQLEIVRFGQKDMLTTSCPPDCICVECLPCEDSNHCTYYDTCPTYCRRLNGGADPT